jgi:anti-sigma factor RsiW
MTRPVTDPWQERLSDYVDGDLDPSTRAALEAHLLTCAECREIRGALERVVARARSVPNRPPAADLWGSIEPRIAAERDRPLPVGRRRQRVVTLTMGRLAAAAAVVAVLAGGFAWTVASRRAASNVADSRRADSIAEHVIGASVSTPALAVASYRDAVADLERVLEGGRGTLRPETMHVIEENLRAIDAAIAQADSALRRDPGSAYLNQYLAETMQRKLKLLRRAVEITTARS